MQKKLFSKPSFLSNRKKLRINPSPFETIIWYQLKDRQVENLKFRRQHSIGDYIVDFYCASEKLVIEIDGDSHFVSNEAVEYDLKRTKFLNGLGIRVLRFSNNDVKESLEDVMRLIAEDVVG